MLLLSAHDIDVTGTMSLSLHRFFFIKLVKKFDINAREKDWLVSL